MVAEISKSRSTHSRKRGPATEPTLGFWNHKTPLISDTVSPTMSHLLLFSSSATLWRPSNQIYEFMRAILFQTITGILNYVVYILINFKIIYYYFMYVNVFLIICLCSICMSGAYRGKKKTVIPRTWRYRCLWTSMCVFETKPMFLVRTANPNF